MMCSKFSETTEPTVSPLARLSRFGAVSAVSIALAFAAPGAGLAQDAGKQAPEAAEDAAAPAAPEAEAAPDADAEGLALELNKLESQGESCRAYVVIRNQSERHYQSFKLDLIEFRTDGVIGHRFAIDLGPIRPEKTLVKLFDIADTRCEEIGSFLINDVMECSAEGAEIDDCFSGLSVSTRADAELTK